MADGRDDDGDVNGLVAAEFGVGNPGSAVILVVTCMVR